MLGGLALEPAACLSGAPLGAISGEQGGYLLNVLLLMSQ